MLSSIRGIEISTLAFWSIGRGFESWSRLFYFFFSKWLLSRHAIVNVIRWMAFSILFQLKHKPRWFLIIFFLGTRSRVCCIEEGSLRIKTTYVMTLECSSLLVCQYEWPKDKPFLLMHSRLARNSYDPKMKIIFEIAWTLFEIILFIHFYPHK